MKETIIDARWIGEAFAADPELKLPQRPRLPPELLVIPFGPDGLIFVGARDKQVLKGRSARTLVPGVLPLLDGEHTLEQLVTSFPNAPGNAVRDIVTLLYSRGLLEDGRAETPPAHLRNVYAFLGRYNDVTRMNRNRGVARQRLEWATVVVGGDAAMAAELAASLAASGVGAVRRASEGTALAGCDLVLAVSASERGEGAALLDAARQANTVSLGTWVGRDTVLLGPLNIPGLSSCYACLRSRGLPEGEPAPEVASFWIHMAALRAIHVLSRISSPPALDSYQLVSLRPDGAVTELRPMPRTPGCERCGLPGPPIAPADPAYQAWSLYNATAKPPFGLLSTKDYEVHYHPKNLELAQQESPACPGAKLVPLPPPKRLAGSPWCEVPAPAEVLSADDLATLLARAAGFQVVAGGARRRVAPTGGDLGSVDLGVVVSRVEGIEPGVYRYHAPRHVLEHFPAIPAGRIGRALGTPDDLSAAVIVGIGGLAKVFQKYAAFAYRIVHFDAGVATAYLHRLAGALGLRVREHAEFRDDVLADLFLLDFDHAVQVPTFAIGLEAKATAEPAGERGMLQRVVEAAMTSRRPQAPATRPAPHPGRSSDVAPPSASFDEVLLGRRSIRSYTRESVPGAVLSELCRFGIDAVSRRIATGAPASTAVRLVLAVADGASDLAGGIYHMHPEQPGTLVPGRRGLTYNDLLPCLLQTAHAAAPAVLFVTGDLGAALADRGARGLREVMVQAGAAIGEVWLAATGYRLGACASGGVIEAGLQALAGADGYRSAPLLAIALGYPRATSAPAPFLERQT